MSPVRKSRPSSPPSKSMGDTVVGRKVLWVDRCESTNDLAWAEAAAGAPEGTVVIADEQTEGRGRHGRAWHAPRGTSLLFSILLRPRLDPDRVSLVTALGGLGAAEGIARHTGLRTLILWPNDIVLRNRKVAGVLVEMRQIGAQGNAFVLGIGLNVNQKPEEFPKGLEVPATSLAMVLGRELDRRALAGEILQSIDDRYRDVLEGREADLARDWRGLSFILGRQVQVREGGITFDGWVEDVHPTEGIVLRLEHGALRGFRGEFVESLRILGTPWA